MAAYFNIDIIIPTLNSGKILQKCLESIKKQNYPSSKIHLYISDGGSTDNTLKIAKKYHAHILKNTLKTAEAGKALGLKKSSSEIVSFIDSDNILPHRNWLTQMILPLIKDSTIIGSEPIAFTYRKNAGFIERYSALIGANDPYAYFNGNYDRYSYLSNKWTNLKIETGDHKSYLKLKFVDSRLLPTIGANGTIYRRSFLDKLNIQDYLFDIDLISQYLYKYPKTPIYFAKTQNSIIHTYCESSFKKFNKKQKRRVKDLLEHQHQRQYIWNNQQFSLNNLLKNNLLFALYSVLILSALFDSLRGYIKKPDLAWFFHPLACFTTFIIYFYYMLLNLFGIKSVQSRSKWSQ
jgi:glycosyltransferase involved in cell wall biosynthesis